MKTYDNSSNFKYSNGNTDKIIEPPIKLTGRRYLTIKNKLRELNITDKQLEEHLKKRNLIL